MQKIDWDKEGDAEEIVNYIRSIPIEILRAEIGRRRKKMSLEEYEATALREPTQEDRDRVRKLLGNVPE